MASRSHPSNTKATHRVKHVMRSPETDESFQATRRRSTRKLTKRWTIDGGLCEVCISCLTGRAKLETKCGRSRHHISTNSLTWSAESGCVLCAAFWDRFTPKEQTLIRQMQDLKQIQDFDPTEGSSFTTLSIMPTSSSDKWHGWTQVIYEISMHIDGRLKVPSYWAQTDFLRKHLVIDLIASSG